MGVVAVDGWNQQVVPFLFFRKDKKIEKKLGDNGSLEPIQQANKQRASAEVTVQRVSCPLPYGGICCSLYANRLTDCVTLRLCVCVANSRAYGAVTMPRAHTLVAKKAPQFGEYEAHRLGGERRRSGNPWAAARGSCTLHAGRSVAGCGRQASISCWMVSCPLNTSPTFSSQTPCVHVSCGEVNLQ